MPLAVLFCFGLIALQERHPVARKPLIILLLIGVVAFEYYTTIEERVILKEQFAFLDWLAEEGSDEIRLINLPMGRDNSERYSLYQSLSGYPHAEGAISRTPSSAYDYIKGNQLLNGWLDNLSVLCGIQRESKYLLAMQQLADAGFTHVVYHRGLSNAGLIAETFVGAEISYADEYVSIFRLGALRDSCPKDVIARGILALPFADVMARPSIIHQRHGTVVTLHQSQPADERVLRYMSQAMFDKKSLVHVSYDEQNAVSVQSSNAIYKSLDTIANNNRAIWLIYNPVESGLSQLEFFSDWLPRHLQVLSQVS